MYIEYTVPKPLFSFDLVISLLSTSIFPRSRFINALNTALKACSFEHDPHIIVVTPFNPGGAH